MLSKKTKRYIIKSLIITIIYQEDYPLLIDIQKKADEAQFVFTYNSDKVIMKDLMNDINSLEIVIDVKLEKPNKNTINSINE